MKHYIVLILKCLKFYNYCCAAVFWKLRHREIAEFPLWLARANGLSPQEPECCCGIFDSRVAMQHAFHACDFRNPVHFRNPVQIMSAVRLCEAFVALAVPKTTHTNRRQFLCLVLSDSPRHEGPLRVNKQSSTERYDNKMDIPDQEANLGIHTLNAWCK